MNQPLRTSSALSLVILSSMIAGCAAPQSHVAAASKPSGEVGLATRALAALNSNDIPQAISLAERAVERTPDDASLRAFLGNAYFAGGRFRSAEGAYRDALTLSPDQPQVILKLALVQIGLGNSRDALATLNAGRLVLDPSDYGLALALAGRPAQAVAVLDAAARQPGADATVRQNLALAHALSGEWTEARVIAGQDVPADQLDQRMDQWMQLAKPGHASAQIAALVGVTPAAVDAGQPVALALNKAAPVAAPQQVARAPIAPVAVAEAAAPIAPAPAPVVAVAPAPPPPRSTVATLAASAVEEAKAVFAAVLPSSAPAKPRRVAQPAVRRGNSPAVVQLGAYKSPDRVLAAWNGAAHKYGALKAYSPMSARFASPKGTFYRLSVRGFASDRDARLTCESLRRQGGSCFVRNVAGDTPVQYASR
jgi:Flp pilus assembly protein TadD